MKRGRGGGWLVVAALAALGALVALVLLLRELGPGRSPAARPIDHDARAAPGARPERTAAAAEADAPPAGGTVVGGDTRTSIIGRLWDRQARCEQFVVLIDGVPVELSEGDFGVIVGEGEHVVDILLAEQPVASYERTLARGEQWDLGEIAPPRRQVTFRGPPGRPVRVAAYEWLARPPVHMTGETTLSLECWVTAAIAYDEVTRAPSLPVTLPAGDGVVELEFPEPASLRCSHPEPHYRVSIQSEAVPGISFHPVGDRPLLVPPGRYSIVVGGPSGTMVVEPNLTAGTMQLEPGQTLECDPSLFEDLGTIELSLRGAEEQSDRVHVLWIGEHAGRPLPDSVQELHERGGRAVSPAQLSRYSFARVPWLDVDICVGARPREEMVTLDQLAPVSCTRVTRARLTDDATVELAVGDPTQLCRAAVPGQ